LVRGKGNLCPEPSAFEFQIKSYRLAFGGFVFRGPMLDPKSVGHSDLTKDDLIGNVDEHSQSRVGQAKKLIETMLPNDGKTHPCRPIIEAAEKEELSYQTVWQAKHKLGIVSIKDAFQGEVMWKWPFHVTLRKRHS
jgi:hypothetical protein